MIRDDFIRKVAKKSGESQKVCNDIFVAIGEVTLEVIAKNDKINFAFGQIGGKIRKARTARNPKTNELVNLPERTGQPYAKFNGKAKE